MQGHKQSNYLAILVNPRDPTGRLIYFRLKFSPISKQLEIFFVWGGGCWIVVKLSLYIFEALSRLNRQIMFIIYVAYIVAPSFITSHILHRNS